jgi:hypothetical protein
MNLIWSTSGLDSDRSTKPATWLFKPGDWRAVEEALGTPLPNDYKHLIGDGIACVFGDELMILSPFVRTRTAISSAPGRRSFWGRLTFVGRDGQRTPSRCTPNPVGCCHGVVMTTERNTSGTHRQEARITGRSSSMGDP